MKTKNIKLVICILLASCQWGCKKFLADAPISNEVRVQTIDDYQQLLNGSAMQLIYVEYFPSLILYDDDIQLNNAPPGSSDVTNRGYHFTWQPNMLTLPEAISAVGSDSYTLPYERIKGCNAVLDGIDDAVGATQKQIDIVKAQALTIRAFYYFRLVNLFGEPYNYNKKSLGVVLKTTANIVENGIARSTVEEVYSQMVKDLSTAVDLFEKYNVGVNKDYQCNLPTAAILLSRVYLYMENYTESIKMATKAITNTGLTDMTQLATFDLASYTNQEVTWIYGAKEYNTATGNLYYFGPSAELMGLYDTDNDMRYKFWFTYPYWWSTTVSLTKFANYSTTPMNTIRVAEAYLNRMEAYALAGNTTAAMTDLNQLRKNRIVGYTDQNITDPTQLLEDIRTERRKELCFEMQRWFDLRRYGMPAIQHSFRASDTDPLLTYTLKEKDPLYTLPIPDSYFGTNNLLQQNASRNEPIRVGQ